MERILPVGSVVELQGKKIMLLGAALQERDGRLVSGYYAVRYPRGFVTLESLGFVAAEEIENVCARGYEDAVGARYIEGVTGLYGELEGKSPREAEELMADAGQAIQKETERLRREREKREAEAKKAE